MEAEISSFVKMSRGLLPQVILEIFLSRRCFQMADPEYYRWLDR